MKILDITVLVIGLITVISCGQNTSSTDKFIDKSNTPQILELDGASSGGGGFSDSYAKESLDLAKYSLAQLIEKTSDEVFENLPEGKRREWIVDVIRNIEYKNEEISRYGRLLKFDYDLSTGKIYATKTFSDTFPYGRFYTRTDKEKVRILIEVQLDILHELAHFYGIGLTEESDDNAEFWAMNFIMKGLNEVVGCELIEEPEPNFETRYEGLVLHKQTGLTRGVLYAEDLQGEMEDGYFLQVSTYDEGESDQSVWEIMFIMYLENALEKYKDNFSSLYQAFSGNNGDSGSYYNPFIYVNESQNYSSNDDSDWNELFYLDKYLNEQTDGDEYSLWYSESKGTTTTTSHSGDGSEEETFYYSYLSKTSFELNKTTFTAKLTQSSTYQFTDLEVTDEQRSHLPQDTENIYNYTCRSHHHKILIEPYLANNAVEDVFN